MNQARLSFVLQEALGWKVYKSRIFAVAECRDDIITQFITIPTEGWQRIFIKRNNVSFVEKLFRQFDPISAYRGSMGKQIRSEIKSFSPSAIYFGGHWLAAVMAGVEPKIPFTVTTDHTRAGMERDLHRGAWSRADMEREAGLFRSAAHVFPMSTWAEKSLIQDCGVDPARITVMPPSITFSPNISRLGPDNNPPRIIFIGNDFVRKGGDRLCRWIVGPLAGKAELHVVSGDPRATGDVTGITFHGRVSNDQLVKGLLPQMDILCHPTQSDMSALSVIEASSAGLPSVISGITGLRDLVIDGKTGFLLAPEDEAGFVAALARLAADPALRRTMGSRAQEYARLKYNANINYNALIDQLIGIGRRR